MLVQLVHIKLRQVKRVVRSVMPVHITAARLKQQPALVRLAVKVLGPVRVRQAARIVRREQHRLQPERHRMQLAYNVKPVRQLRRVRQLVRLVQKVHTRQPELKLVRDVVQVTT